MEATLNRDLRIGSLLAILITGLFMLGFSALAQSETTANKNGVLLTLKGAVTPASADYLEREIKAASDSDKELIIIEIDTPGGLVDSMKTIIKAILASDTPIATYVSPQGARSASAGLYIMYAAHISAMAPSTNTGAATPVTIGGGEQPEENPLNTDQDTSPPNDDDVALNEEDSNSDEAQNDTAPPKDPLSNDDALRAKVINDSVAYIRSLAEERDRNADWAEDAVRDAVSITSREALRINVIDYIANDIDDLLQQIDGATFVTASGEKTLTTSNLKLTRVEPTQIEKILGFFANPNVAVILMSLATTGIIIEMWNPGSILPGVLGVTFLLLGLYSFQVLPYNGLGAGLMILGVVLMTVEAYSPTFGIAGLTGLASFGFGLYTLFPAGFNVSPIVIATLLASMGGLLALVLFAFIGSHSHGPMLGGEAIRKREGVVDEWDGKEGWVVVEGERWRARSSQPLSSGDKIKVIEVDGLVLVVRQAKAVAVLSGLISGQNGSPKSEA